jgi:ATP/maltotriose-dependent transcriptional regulator MalT
LAKIGERNELDSAKECARLSTDLCERSGRNRTEEIAYFSLVQSLLAEGDLAAAESELQLTDLAVSMPGTFPMARAMKAASRTLFSIHCGDLKAATEWGVRLEQYVDVLPLQFHHIRGRLLIARGDKKKAMALLQDLYDRYARVGG